MYIHILREPVFYALVILNMHVWNKSVRTYTGKMKKGFVGTCTVLPGKRVDSDHCVVSADFMCESCMYSVSILYTVRSMIGLSTCQIMEYSELSSGI